MRCFGRSAVGQRLVDHPGRDLLSPSVGPGLARWARSGRQALARPSSTRRHRGVMPMPVALPGPVRHEASMLGEPLASGSPTLLLAADFAPRRRRAPGAKRVEPRPLAKLRRVHAKRFLTWGALSPFEAPKTPCSDRAAIQSQRNEVDAIGAQDSRAQAAASGLRPATPLFRWP